MSYFVYYSCIYATLQGKWQPFESWIGLLICLSTGLAYGVLRLMQTNAQKQAQIQVAHAELTDCLHELVALSGIRDRNRIAFEFYDALGHAIAALHIQVQAAYKLHSVHPEQSQAALAEAYQLSGSILREIRQTVHTLAQDTQPELPHRRAIP
ncbi:MAG: histidine kinase [Oculatellaceae cyanobacterium Prado106]|nr:histidine kinase [Oculatellaceae cyanobacterium Prado106]